MNNGLSSLSSLYGLVRKISRFGTLVVISIFLLFHLFGAKPSISFQLVIALLGLVVGIPHGAIDHLIAIPQKPLYRFVMYIVGYSAIAILAGFAIATWNIAAFNIVVIMSGLHFGFGDASFINEQRLFTDGSSEPLWIECLYAIPAGFLPVALPLTDSRTTSALERIRPTLIHWSGSHAHALRTVSIMIAAISLCLLFLTKHFEHFIDLSILLALVLVTPPLIAFATYFGIWHAQRHTARLVPRLPRAIELVKGGKYLAGYLAAIKPGLYAIFGALALAGTLMVVSPRAFSSSLLWSVLVIIWALTVPHMLTTARLDREAIGGRFQRP